MQTTRREQRAMRGASWRRFVSLGAALTVAALVALPSASAHTVEPIVYSGNSFDGSGSTAGAFDRVEAIAVDSVRHKVYTAELGHGGSVSRFDMNGVTDPCSGLAGASSTEVGEFSYFGSADPPVLTVDNSAGSTGAFYGLLLPGSQIKGFGYDGLPKSGFPATSSGGSCGIAVDPQGDVWFGDQVANKVFEVSGKTGLQTGEKINPGDPVWYTVIDSDGNFYVSERQFTSREVMKFDPEGTLLYNLDIPEPANEFFGLGIGGMSGDPSQHNVYVLTATAFSSWTILEYPPDGTDPIGELTVPGFEPVKRIAVDGASHDLYVSAGNVVKIYEHGAPITVPDVTTDPAVPTPTTAELRGTINPDGVPTTDCHFEWGPTAAYGTSVPCDQGDVHTGEGDVHVTAPISGITKGSSYHFRLVAKNSNDFVVKGKAAVLVGHDLPKVFGEYISDINTDSAVIHATAKPEAGRPGVHVEYGPDTGYGQVAPVPDVILSSTVQERDAVVNLTGLEPGTEYHYRVVATNAAGSTPSADHPFKPFGVLEIDDDCPNHPARQQTGSALLLDCRAYELVSASDTGGYNVESDGIPGQEQV